jgi:hypothetical protein
MLEIIYSTRGGIVVLIMIWLWNNIVPRITQRFIHQEPNISGKWNTNFKENDQIFHEVVTLVQRGRRVSGQIELKLLNEEDSNYKFEGTFKYLILTCMYHSTDLSEYEQGVFALRYTKKNKLVGQHVLISKQSDHLISSDYEWKK